MSSAKHKPGKVLKQIGALPLRSKDDAEVEILLVTTRTTRRWSIPKGWPIKGLKAFQVAGQEALEEAGISGRVKPKSSGRYLYWKRLDGYFALCKVKVYEMRVEQEHDRWPEETERRRGWFALLDAADLVEEPGLRKLLREWSASKGKEVHIKR